MERAVQVRLWYLLIWLQQHNGLSIVDIECASGKAVKDVFDKTIKILFN
ncbi:hypothetical protein [Phosphitispora sp. TUW77]